MERSRWDGRQGSHVLDNSDLVTAFLAGNESYSPRSLSLPGPLNLAMFVEPSAEQGLRAVCLGVDELCMHKPLRIANSL